MKNKDSIDNSLWTRDPSDPFSMKGAAGRWTGWFKVKALLFLFLEVGQHLVSSKDSLSELDLKVGMLQ